MQPQHPLANMSFDHRAQSFSQPQSNQMMYAPPPQQNVGAYRSFPDMNGAAHGHQQLQAQPQIYTAVYSGVSVYEMEINGVAVMRRRSDSWLNATQILKVAGVDKGKRTKVLEKEIRHGQHEKAQGGYGKYQGTWIPYRRGREFCRQYGVEDLLRPLLDYDMGSDGTAQPGIDTPTKEQAMAANRKRFYSQTQDPRQTQASGGTFFSNLSSTASNAISAMNKAARLNTPTPRPGSAPRRPGSVAPGSHPNSQQSFMGAPNSQRSMPGLPNERSFNSINDSAYITQGVDQAPLDSQEPPRKRIKGDIPSLSQPHGLGDLDISMREGTPTEPNDSFLYHASSQQITADGDVPVALPPLPHPSDRRSEEKQSLLLDLFADSNRTDFSSHPAFTHLSGADFDIPLDQTANTALHWAATLARVQLIRLLIAKGANIFRGNIVGETALMFAVQVKNSSDHGCFPDLLDLLSPLIEIRDSKGRTVLHHIGLACGIKGRSASSKYYLEALLEFLVRGNSASQRAAIDAPNGLPSRPIGLMRFMSEMVNARDISGNTALNLVARIGNRSIIRQLIEVQADPTIPNNKGLRPIDFGVEPKEADMSDPTSQAFINSSSQSKGGTKADEVGRELAPLLQSSVTEMQSQFVNELNLLQERADATTTQIQDLSNQQKVLSEQVESAQNRLRSRLERKQRIQNLHRAINDLKEGIATRKANKPPSPDMPPGGLAFGEADSDFAVSDPAAANGAGVHTLPDVTALNARLTAYKTLNSGLSAHLTSLKSRDTELETKYRKVVSLCTNVPEDKVDSVLGQLLLALESEPENDVGRVREFLKRVEAVAAP